MRLRSLVTGLLAMLAVSQVAPAGYTVIGSNPTTSLAVPFGLTSDGPTDPSNRYQQIIASSVFTTPITINALSFFTQAPGSGGNFNPVTYNFYLSTTKTAVNALDPTNLANNVSPTETLFASISPTGSAPSTWTVSASKSFSYDPSLGNLMLDIQIVGQTTNDPSAYFAAFDGVANYNGLSSSADNFGGNTPSTGLSMGIAFTSVPEPSSLLLGLIGTSLAFLVRRRFAA